MRYSSNVRRHHYFVNSTLNQYKIWLNSNATINPYILDPASSSIVMAMHHSENGVRAARVLSYALHTIVASNQTYSVLLFQPAWFKRHQQHHFYGKPVTLWEPDSYESNTITFLPVQSIISRTASLVDRCTLSNSSHENVLLVCPIVE